MVDYNPGKTTGADGTLDYTGGYFAPISKKKVWFDYASTQIYVGSVVAYQIAADPRDSFVVGPGVDVVVLAAVTGVGKARIAGVVVDLGDTGGVEDGWITIANLIPGQIYTFAVVTAIDAGDGLKLANSGAYADDSGTYAVTDAAIALYDEDDANNPHGVACVNGSTIGLVEAVWTGADLADTA